MAYTIIILFFQRENRVQIIPDIDDFNFQRAVYF